MKNLISCRYMENEFTGYFPDTTAVLVLQAHKNMIKDGGCENSHFLDVDILASR